MLTTTRSQFPHLSLDYRHYRYHSPRVLEAHSSVSDSFHQFSPNYPASRATNSMYASTTWSQVSS